ncbi:hypothetical protein COCVIDRAFT_116537 [Bipolaris victoriae FI3]|uniref:Uncharacterized protein n=1 Tax=Bipolaris victoriae (strain FI3) TaxID=930091 RepID=W7DQF9_BIPV3|nr:hypothetical protein COCVIDRAFT_116537 [Bipolaris victoriae FI3]
MPLSDTTADTDPSSLACAVTQCIKTAIRDAPDEFLSIELQETKRILLAKVSREPLYIKIKNLIEFIFRRKCSFNLKPNYN